jgi:hypothetical protein
MPNWCHNTLTVSGEEAELTRFFDAAYDGPQQPLSFAKIVAEPSDAEYEAMQEAAKVPCSMCGATGKLAKSPDDAKERGVPWYPWMAEPKRKRKCNVCEGSGKEVPFGSGWHDWRSEHWGCKWDASFADSGPLFALGQEGMDVDISKSTQGVTKTPTVVVYKFDTPWSPPMPFLISASEQHPELEFVLRFGEPGNNYAGETKVVAGVTITDEELDVVDVLAPEEMWF